MVLVGLALAIWAGLQIACKYPVTLEIVQTACIPDSLLQFSDCPGHCVVLRKETSFNRKKSNRFICIVIEIRFGAAWRGQPGDERVLRAGHRRLDLLPGRDGRPVVEYPAHRY